jgi:hypothetical protein
VWLHGLESEMNAREFIVSQLLQEAGNAYVRDTIAAVLERRKRELAKFDGMTIMCGCGEWLTCEHPWPQLLKLDTSSAS